jgi:hypothetical protein
VHSQANGTVADVALKASYGQVGMKVDPGFVVQEVAQVAIRPRSLAYFIEAGNAARNQLCDYGVGWHFAAHRSSTERWVGRWAVAPGLLYS